MIILKSFLTTFEASVIYFEWKVAQGWNWATFTKLNKVKLAKSHESICIKFICLNHLRLSIWSLNLLSSESQIY